MVFEIEGLVEVELFWLEPNKRLRLGADYLSLHFRRGAGAEKICDDLRALCYGRLVRRYPNILCSIKTAGQFVQTVEDMGYQVRQIH